MEAANHNQATTPKSPWVPLITRVGAIACGIWTVYRVGVVQGWLQATIVFVVLAVLYTLGVSVLFAVAASVVCFVFRDAGIWLALIAFALAAVAAYSTLAHRPRKRMTETPQ